MPNRHHPNHRLVALFALGALLLTYPFISLCNRAVLYLGVPLLYLYLFIVWTGLIIGMILITPKIHKHHPKSVTKPTAVPKSRGRK